MYDNFDPCMEEIFPQEGGYVNHKDDPGGETNMGISRRSYPDEDIKGMTKARAKEIYRRDFWDKVRGDDLPYGIDLVALDPAINSGVSRGSRWLQQGLGMTGKDVDGIVGNATVAAAKAAPDRRAVIKAACAARMGFLRGLKTWGTFGRGWSRRVASVEAAAVSMSAQAVGLAPGPVLRDERDAAAEAAKIEQKRAVGTGAGAGVGGGGGLSLDGLPDWAVLVAVAALLGVAVYVWGRKRHEDDRAAAYEAQARKEAIA